MCMNCLVFEDRCAERSVQIRYIDYNTVESNTPIVLRFNWYEKIIMITTYRFPCASRISPCKTDEISSGCSLSCSRCGRSKTSRGSLRWRIPARRVLDLLAPTSLRQTDPRTSLRIRLQCHWLFEYPQYEFVCSWLADKFLTRRYLKADKYSSIHLFCPACLRLAAEFQSQGLISDKVSGAVFSTNDCFKSASFAVTLWHLKWNGTHTESNGGKWR